MTAYLRALDTFVAEIDGIPRGVVKGAVLPESDPVVRHDLANGGLNFGPLDAGDDEAPAKSAPVKADPKAAEPVKPEMPSRPVTAGNRPKAGG